LKRKSGEGTSR